MQPVKAINARNFDDAALAEVDQSRTLNEFALLNQGVAEVLACGDQNLLHSFEAR
jgi:hypothetical protein